MPKAAPTPDYGREIQLGAEHGHPIAGVDEAGRGPWAGPVVAAAAMFVTPHSASVPFKSNQCEINAHPSPEFVADLPFGLQDSKKLSAIRREQLFQEISDHPYIEIGVGIADVARIDKSNILAATLWAMGEAVRALPTPPRAVLVDGNQRPALLCPLETVVKGDAKCLTIAAASIVAKVTRDRMMLKLGSAYPNYGFERHKGYGTKQHAEALKLFGVTAHHRRSFKPIKKLLAATCKPQA